MTDREARRDALSTWFMEFSVLWAVFPPLDSLVEGRPIDWFVRALSIGISLTAAGVGLIFKRGQRTWME
jgi:hypothetical protein